MVGSEFGMVDQRIRASDGDRERVVAILREQTAEGRLTLEEFDERMSAAYAATTWDDLRGLTRDLPVDLALGPPNPAGTDPLERATERLERPARLVPRHRLVPLALALVALSAAITLSAVWEGAGGFLPLAFLALFWVSCGGRCGTRSIRRHREFHR